MKKIEAELTNTIFFKQNNNLTKRYQNGDKIHIATLIYACGNWVIRKKH